MIIFASHGNSCRVSGSGFEYEGFVFFSFSPKWNSAFFTPGLTPTSNLLRLLALLAYQPSNTHTLWEFFCISWKIRQASLCSFESCQLMSEFSCHKTKMCCLEIQVGFPDPDPARVGPLHPPSLSGWVLRRASPVLSVQGLRQSPSHVHLKPGVPPLGWTESERATLISPCPLSGHLGPPWVLPSLQAALEQTEDFLKEHLFPEWPLQKPPPFSWADSLLLGFPGNHTQATSANGVLACLW